MADKSNLLYVSSAVEFAEAIQALSLDPKSNTETRTDQNSHCYGSPTQQTTPNFFPKRDQIDLVFADLGDVRAKMLLLDHLGVSRKISITVKSLADRRILPVGPSGTSVRDSQLGWKAGPLGSSSATIALTFQWPTRISRAMRGLGFASFETSHRLLSLEVLAADPESASWCTSLPSVWTPLSLAAEHDHREFTLAGSFAVGSGSVESGSDDPAGLTDAFQRRLIVGDGVSGLGRAVTWSDVDAGLVDAVFSDKRVFDFVPPVDVVAFNPRGFNSQPVRGAVLTAAGMRHGEPVVRFLDEAQEIIHVFDPRHGVRESLIHDLRPFSYVGLVPREFSGPRDFLTVLGRLLVAGVPVWVVGGVPHFAEEYLGAPLVQLLDSFDPFGQNDVLGREEWSVAARRLARDRLTVDSYWERQLLQDPALDGYVSNKPSVSAIMCTMRAEFVQFALDQMARQTYPNLEVVLVLHGLAQQDPAIAQAIAGYRRPLTVVEVAPEVVFGGALNRGVAASHGEYISKIDDDDWYGEHHISDLVATRSYAPADLTGADYEFIYFDSLDMTFHRILDSEVFNSQIIGGTLLIKRSTLRSAGGFNAVSANVDSFLIANINGGGGRIYKMHGHNFVRSRRTDGHVSPEGIEKLISGKHVRLIQGRPGLSFPRGVLPSVSPKRRREPNPFFGTTRIPVNSK